MVCYNYMTKYKTNIAQVDAETGYIDSYDQLLERSIKTALAMLHMNITSEDIVCVCSFDQINYCVPLLASLFLGVRVTCLDPRLCPPFLVQIITQTQTRLIFADIGIANVIDGKSSVQQEQVLKILNRSLRKRKVSSETRHFWTHQPR